MQVDVQRLDKRHNVKSFDCGDQPLNDYLKRYAIKNQERFSIGVTYVAVEADSVLGYHTLAVASLPKIHFPDNSRSQLTPYPDVPAILLGRLAVDQQFQSRGIGPQLLRHALTLSLQTRAQVGCRCLIVDAYPNRVTWYEKFGFLRIGGAPEGAPTQKMFIDLRTVETATTSARI